MFWRWCGGTQDNNSVHVCVCQWDCLSTERSMFQVSRFAFLAPIVPFVLYYLRSVTHLLLRIGSNRQGRAQQPAFIVFLQNQGCFQKWLEQPSSCFCLLLPRAGSGSFSIGYRGFESFWAELQRSDWKCPLRGGLWGWGCFPFLLVLNTG